MIKKTRKNNVKTPKVSVLMPIYNTPVTHLREAINSILQQTFVDFEYLILNDSPDNKKLDEVVMSYDDPRIRYLKNDINLGLEDSTNRLIDESLGDYIAIFDHDDISLPERFQKEVDFLDKHPKVGVVSAQFRLFGIQNFDTENPLDSRSIRATLLTASCVSHTTAMFRKAALVENNIRYEKDFFPAASYRIITRLALVTDIQNLPDVLLKYRMDGNNTSIKHAKRRAESRERIRAEYGESLIKKAWQEKGKAFDSIELLDVSSRFNDCRYYKARRGDEVFFIKSEGKDLGNEYRMAKTMFEKSEDYFIEPVDYHKDEFDYLMMRWCDGVRLDKCMEQKTLTKKQKESFIQDLCGISKLLRDAGIVHRDITPQNLLVSSGRLMLIDFHFAVEYDNYKELEYVENNINEVSVMGEPFAAGIFKWDDAFSLVKIAEYTAGENAKDDYPAVRKVVEKIGDRVIIPDGAVLRNVIVEQRKTIDENNAMLAKFNLLRESLPYRVTRKVYRAAKKLR